MNGDDNRSSLSGLTDDEAKEFHRIFMTSFIVWVVLCFIAHVLVWNWRPWFPGAESDAASVIDSVKFAAHYVSSFLA